MDKGQEHHIEFLEAREDAAKALEPTKQPLDFITPVVHGSIVLPCGDAVLLGQHDRNEAKIESQLPGIVAFVGSVHLHLDGGAVQRDGIDFDSDDLSMLQALEHTIQHTGLRPAAPASIDGMPATEAFGQATPFAALLGHIEDGVQDLKIRETDIAEPTWQTVLNQAILLLGDLHSDSISQSTVSANTL